MMHLVTPELDRGPPITYCSFPIRGGSFDLLWKDFEDKLKEESLEEIITREGEEEPLFKKIRQEGALWELPLIIQTIKAFADKRVKVKDGKIIAEGKVVLGGYDLTEEIESLQRA
jgi:phosphoribosylglycinamide formyltransferase-1